MNNKRGSEGDRTFRLADRLKDPAVLVALLVIAFGIYSVLDPSSITGKAIARPADECSVVAGGTDGVMLLGSAGPFQLGEKVAKASTCGVPIQRPASELRSFLLLGQQCAQGADGVITLTTESGQTQRLVSGCADAQLNTIAHSDTLVKHVCSGNDVQVNLINCNCADANGADCQNLVHCDSNDVCNALPDGTSRSCVDKNNGLLQRCYITFSGSACPQNFADECGPGLNCVGGRCEVPGAQPNIVVDNNPPVNEVPAENNPAPQGPQPGELGGACLFDATNIAGLKSCNAGLVCQGDVCISAPACRADADCEQFQRCAEKPEGTGKRCLKFIEVACVEDSECLENAVCIEKVAGQGKKCFGTTGQMCGGVDAICAPGFSCQNNVCAQAALLAGGGDQMIRPTLLASGAVPFSPFTFPAVTDAPSEFVKLPFSAGYGDLGFCRDYFKLSRKDANFCHFEVGPGNFKTVGRHFIAKLPSVVSSVQSIAVDVKKLANSGAGDVGYHLLYSTSATFDKPSAWTWATYCILKADQSEMTCTKNFATPVSVGYVMVARASWGANSPTPYVTDIRVLGQLAAPGGAAGGNDPPQLKGPGVACNADAECQQGFACILPRFGSQKMCLERIQS
ncbi:MAG: hypothetical protein Q7R76_04200 [Candidatus Woesearchaeota archaeon]|nr:hypothetical protein [Candidatus Woesearchaeota archaeon]